MRPQRPDLKVIEQSSLSKKWLKLAIDKGLDGVVLNLARLDTELAFPALSAMFERLIKSKLGSVEYWRLHAATSIMIDLGHPGSVDAMLAIIKRLSESSSYYGTWILNKINDLPPAEAIPKLEALLPSLKDKIADEVINHIYTLKHRLTK